MRPDEEIRQNATLGAFLPGNQFRDGLRLQPLRKSSSIRSAGTGGQNR
jgi:hypothetical protein